MRRERGQSLVEGALVMLVFFALLLGIIDISQLVFSHQALVARVSEAARWGAIHPDAGAEPVRKMIGLPPENVVVDFREIEGVRTIHVEVVNFEVPLFAPWWPGLAHRLMDARPVSVTVPLS
jgi:hypothetical protein